MKWCQSCNFDYEDYVENCSDCGALLVSELEYKQFTKHNQQEHSHELQGHELQGHELQGHELHSHEPLNLSVVYESTLESDILIVSALLKEHGIDSEIKNTGIGSYLQIYSGVNYLGTSICVNEKDAEVASGLIASLWGESDHEVTSGMLEYQNHREKSLNIMRNILKVVILLTFGSGLIISLMMTLFKF